MSNPKLLLLAAGAMLACVGVGTARATTYTDNFTGTSAQLQWTHLNDACLTAGDGTGSIPACPSSYPTDAAGQGALLLTPAQNDQTGAILSAFPPFPMSQGIQITFTTYTFGGDSGGLAKNGADGIVFFLTDGTQAAPTKTGAEGGSMGYDCSNDNGIYDGIAYGYLGLGIDEYGNFLNTGDNGTNPEVSPTGVNGGIYNSNVSGLGSTSNGTNPYYDGGTSIYPGGGLQYQPERIGLRGAGNTNMAELPLMPGASSSFYAGGATYNNGYNCSSSTSGSGRRQVTTTTCNPTTGNKVWLACSSGTYVTAFTNKTYTYQPKSNSSTTASVTYEVPTATQPITYNYNAIPGGYAILPEDPSQGNIPSSTNQPIANNSKTATRNPTAATAASDIAWPITYRLTISSGGLLNFAYSYNNGAFQQVLTNHDITQDNGPLPSLLRFGFSAGTGGSNNVHEITCFQASPLQASASVAANTTPSGRVIAGTQVFVPGYSTNNWWGSLQAIQVTTDPATGSIGFNTVATWDAKCVLTGGGCDSMGINADGTPTTSVPVQAPANRTLLTSDALGAGAGVTLAWANLNTPQQDALNAPINPPDTSLDPTPGPNRVAWLTGDRSVEQLASGCTSPPSATQPCDLRARTYVLGDIINSSPAFVGAPVQGMYPDTFADLLDPTDPNPENNTTANPTTVYSQYANSNASRENVVYIGSNDGFVHGFQAGSYDGGTYDSSTNNGEELVAYMPYDVLLDKTANLTNPLYTHDYLVDATPGSGDLFYGGTWHTWLVGGVGSAGSEIYALNITNPATAADASNFSASDVIGDWDQSTLTHLGNTVGTPVIVRMHNGKWAFIFGSGLVSNPTNSSPTEGVYIGLVDPTSGAVTFQFLDTGVEPKGVTNSDGSTTAGGIAYVTPADLDGDHITDYLYAGDTQGNVWRFDVTSADPTQWSGASATNPPIVVYTAKGAGGAVQPITTSLQLGLVTTGTGNTETRVMIYFGTGQLTQQSTSSAALYATGSQTFYGIWDWNMDAWNAKSSVQYASLDAPQTVSRSNLVAQTVTATTAASGANPATRSLSDLTVCWADQSACSGSPQYGWYFDLPDPGPTTGTNAGTSEQIIYNPTIIGGEIVVNTATPPVVNASECNAGTQGGWTMAFDPETGGAIPGGFFGNNASGLGNSAVGTSTALLYGGNLIVVSNAGSGSYGGAGHPIGNPGHPQAGSVPGRVSWRELVNQ